ncbi:BgTH12-03893 [Blumeria graminis f. sp. triticale]|nr:BgTH12-03893 [Blumeria graminis f. sp. triticale]
MDEISTEKYSAHTSGHDSSYRETSRRILGESSRSELMQNQAVEGKKGLLSRRGHSRTKTLSSIHLPTGVRDLTPRDGWGLARRTIPRADSFQVLGSIFSRSTKKEKKDQLMETNSSLSSSNSLMMETAYTEASKDVNGSRQILIPRPNGLRNVKRAIQEQRSYLVNKSRTELVSKHSNSSSMSASVDLDINDTKYENLYFENFSSESLGMKIYDDFQSPLLEKNLHIRERAVLRKKPKNDAIPGWPAKTRREMMTCQPPWSPPSSNPSPREQLSSRGNSQTSLSSENSKGFYSENPSEVIWNNPYPFGMPTPPSRSGHQEFFSQTSCDSPTASYKKPWPLPNSIHTPVQGHVKLAKHENYGSLSQRRNQESRRCSPAPQNEASNAESNALESRNQRQEREVAQTQEQIPSLTSETESESWESDIDWCYEHEVEADCDYQWVEDGQTNSQDELPQTPGKFQPDYLSVPNEEFDSMSFSASLLLPMQLDVPYLSSLSLESSIYPELSISTREQHSPQYLRSRADEYNAHSSYLTSNNCRTPCEQAVFQYERPRNRMSPQISPLYPYNSSSYHGKNRSSSVPLSNQSLYQTTTRSSSIANIPSERFRNEASLENLSTKVDEILPLFSPKQTFLPTPNTERTFSPEHSVRPTFQGHPASKWDLGAMGDGELTHSVVLTPMTLCGTSSDEPMLEKPSRPGLARRKHSMPLECKSRTSSLAPARTGRSCSYGLFPQV